MIDKSSLVHGSLALAAVAVAAAAWLAPKGAAVDQVTVIDGKADDVTELRWTDAQAEVTLARAKDGVQVAVTRKPAGAAATAAVGAPALTRTYPGTITARELFDKLMPLHASRDLGPVSGKNLATFGLDAPTGKLVLKMGRDEHAVELGASTFGGASSYVRAGDHVYLMGAATFGALRNGAIGLTEHSLVVLPPQDVERVTIVSGDRRRELVQRFGNDRARAFLADPAAPDERLVQVGNWVDRLMRTRMTDFAGAAPTGEPQVVVELTAAGKRTATVRLWAPGEAGATVVSSAYAEPVLVAKPTAEALLKDVDAVLEEGRK